MPKNPLYDLLEHKKVKKFVDKSKKYVPLDIIYKEKRLITYLFGNQITFLAQLILTFILTETLHIWYMGSYGISLIVGLGFMFWYHKQITFSIKDTSNKHFIVFAVIMIGSFIVSWILVYLITSILPFLHYILTIILVSIPVSIFTYKIIKRVVFKIKWQDELFENL